MAATIYGNPGQEPGDQQVYLALRALPSDCIIYAQPVLTHQRDRRYPDYVVVSERWGVIVLEVKDWTDVVETDAKHA